MGKATIKKSTLSISENGLEDLSPEKRLAILKTYKIYIGGQFPRTESGRYYIARNADGKKLANVCLSSRKDFRDAVVAARNAFADWGTKAASNRGQILYRIAEMLEGRKAQFIEELITQDATKPKAEKEVAMAIDRLIYYAGWCDKYLQLFSSVNPVASSHFNFSVPEPTGVVSVIAPQNNSLLGLVSVIAPVIAVMDTAFPGAERVALLAIIPATKVALPVSVVTPTLTLMALSAFTAKALKVEGAVAKVTLRVAPVAFRVTVPPMFWLWAAVIPLTVMSLFVAFPIVRSVAVIFCSSAPLMVIPPAVAPSPMV